VRQCEIGVEFEGHGSSVSIGINAMNFVMPDKCSVIQIVLTRSSTSDGPRKIPATS
jgi:hypothetical protein